MRVAAVCFALASLAASAAAQTEFHFDLTGDETARVLAPAQNLAPPEFVNAMRAFQRIHERLSRRPQGEPRR